MKRFVLIGIKSFGDNKEFCKRGADRCPFLTDRILYKAMGRELVPLCKLFGEEIDDGRRCDGCLEADYNGAKT